MKSLTPRETQVLELCAQGHTSHVIGKWLGISKSCVEFHIKNAILKLQAHNRSHAVAIGMKAQYIKPFLKNKT